MVDKMKIINVKINYEGPAILIEKVYESIKKKKVKNKVYTWRQRIISTHLPHDLPDKLKAEKYLLIPLTEKH